MRGVGMCLSGCVGSLSGLCGEALKSGLCWVVWLVLRRGPCPEAKSGDPGRFL